MSASRSVDGHGANPHKVLAFYDTHVHPFLDVLSRLIEYAKHHHTLLYVLLFPLLLVLSSIFGGFAVWAAMAAITMHHYIQATAHKKRALFEAMTAQAQEINADLEDTRVWVNDILNLWWRTRASDLLTQAVAMLERKLNANLPAFLMAVHISSLHVGKKPPRVDKVLRLEDNVAQNRMELDVSASYGGEMECTLVAALSENLKIQLRLSNIFIKTKIKLEVQFAQDRTTLAVATIGDPAFDFSLFPMKTGLDLTNIPGLFDWIQFVALDQASRHLRWPNKVTVLNNPYQPDSAPSAPPRRVHSDNDFVILANEQPSPNSGTPRGSTPRSSGSGVSAKGHQRSGSVAAASASANGHARQQSSGSAPNVGGGLPVAAPAGHTRQGSGSSAAAASAAAPQTAGHTRQSSSGSSAPPAPLVMSKNPSAAAAPTTVIRTNRTGQAENITTKDQALGLFGITPSVKEYVENLCTNEDIFLQFPMADYPHHGFLLTKRQHKHALRMVSEVPQLAALRFRLCPMKLDDDRFWYVYFSLLRNRMPLLFVEEDERIVEYDWELLHRLTKKEKAEQVDAIDLQWIP